MCAPKRFDQWGAFGFYLGPECVSAVAGRQIGTKSFQPWTSVAIAPR
jgi:hypothetical protein